MTEIRVSEGESAEAGRWGIIKMKEMETEIRKRNKTAAEIGEEYKKFIVRKVFFILALIPIFGLITGVSTSLGSENITVWDAYSAIFHRFSPDYFTIISDKNRKTYKWIENLINIYDIYKISKINDRDKGERRRRCWGGEMMDS